MIAEAKYVHTNLIARDWRSLVQFYREVFGCVPVPPERDFAGPDLEAGTGLAGARLQGAHLRLPGHGSSGPTLEVFQYGETVEAAEAAVNRPGFAHIAFSVGNVLEARDEVLSRGGSPIGEVVTMMLAATSDGVAGASVTWCYVTDPEGNIIELQSMS